MQSPKTLSTLKIIISYVLLGILALLVSVYVHGELQDYFKNNTEVRSDTKLLLTNSLLTNLHEAESVSKLAIQSKKQKHFTAYTKKIDSVRSTIDSIKKVTKSLQQQNLLDSLKVLLGKKEANIKALLTLKAANNTSLTITMALQQFDEMEASLGIITPEALAPNLKSLSPKAQETITKVAKYLNENIPENNSNAQTTKKTDSILKLSKNLLKEVTNERALAAKSLANKENSISATDLELSQQLRQISTSLEKEILLNSFNENIKKEAILKQSIRLAGLAAVLGFIVVGVFVFILKRDFWKAKLYRQKLEKEKHLSETLLKSREHLIRAVSHDVRTPLNTIFGYAELLRTSALSQKQSQQLAQIKSATDYVNNLVQDLLDFSQLEAGKMRPKNSTFNLHFLIKETAKNISMSHENEVISLILDIDKKLNRNVFNDALRIRQIISNILDNAYKFTKAGEIKIAVKLIQKIETDTSVSICISDTGIGIPTAQQKQIFTEFTQAENKAYEKQGGYGLGLTISKKLTELLGGSLGLQSTEGKGSLFTLTLPILFVDEASINTETKKVSSFKKPKSILVIEDDSTLLQLIGKLLKQANISAILINDFDELEQQNHLLYDIVLTDIEMPKTSGYNVLKNLSSGIYPHYNNQAIIAMTGRQDLDAKLLIEKGFSAVIRKPFTAIGLLKTVCEFIKIEDATSQNSKSEKTCIGLDEQKLFSVENLKLFLGGDINAIQELIQTFKNETLKNKRDLLTANQQQNYKQLSTIAHRMLPMFRQLNITRCIPILENLEKLDSEVNYHNVSHNQFQELHLALEQLLGALKNYDLAKHLNHSA